MVEQDYESETAIFSELIKIPPSILDLGYSDSDNNIKNKVSSVLLLGNIRTYFLDTIKNVPKLSETRKLWVTLSETRKVGVVSIIILNTIRITFKTPQASIGLVVFF